MAARRPANLHGCGGAARIARKSGGRPASSCHLRRDKNMIVLDPLFRIAMIAIDFYIWLVIIGAILSWLVAFNVVNTSNRVVYLIGDFLYRITEPALRPLRRIVPNLGGIDISPVVLIFALYFLQMVLANIHAKMMM
jgi:YggT family protein